MDDAYNIKQTQERKLVEETLAKLTSQRASFSESETSVIPKTRKSSDSLFFRKGLGTP